MEKPYFIMMYSQCGDCAVAMVEDTEAEEVCFFESMEVARSKASEHPWCKAFGYEIFCMGTGTR